MRKYGEESEKLPVIDVAAAGRNIAGLRRAAGFSMKDLQRVFGFTTAQANYKWQTGRAMPALDNLLALAWMLGVHYPILGQVL